MAWDMVSIVLAGLGAVFVVGSFVLNLALLRRMVRERRVRAGLNTVTYSVLLVAVWVMVNWMNDRYPYRFDVTFSKQFSISSETRAHLERLETPLRITTLLRPGEMLERDVMDLLQGYERVSRLVEVRHIDIEFDPGSAQELAYRLQTDLEVDSVVFEYGKRSKHVTRSEIEEMDLSGYPYGRPGPPKFKGEEAFTSAIIEILEDRDTRLCFSTGHGERSLEGYERDALGELTRALKRRNMQPVGLALIGAEAVPVDCEVVVIAGPRKLFVDREIEVLDAYLARGGRLLVMVDPMSETGLGRLLGRWGVDMGEDVVIDPASRIPLVGPTTLYMDSYPEHDITKPLQGIAAVFAFARSMEAGKPAVEGLTATSIARTSGQSWAETDLDSQEASYDEGKDRKGPLSIAVAVGPADASAGIGMPPGPKTRLVAIGDADFVSDGQLGNPANADFVLNSINWLIEREQLISISSRSPDDRSVTLGMGQSLTILSLVLVAMPLAAITAGGIMWWCRRK